MGFAYRLDPLDTKMGTPTIGGVLREEKVMVHQHGRILLAEARKVR